MNCSGKKMLICVDSLGTSSLTKGFLYEELEIEVHLKDTMVKIKNNKGGVQYFLTHRFKEVTHYDQDEEDLVFYLRSLEKGVFYINIDHHTPEQIVHLKEVLNREGIGLNYSRIVSNFLVINMGNSKGYMLHYNDIFI